jgi:hypothetical protein
MINLLIITLFCFSFSSPTENSLGEFTENADTFFKNYVREGKVDYDKIKKNIKELHSLVQQIEEQRLSSASIQDKKGFYINAYNLLVINQISAQIPVRDDWYQTGFFDKVKHKIAGEEISLDVLEKERLFTLDRDARIHFALVCAARGCPPLKSGAYKAKDLDMQLDEQARITLNDQNFIRTDNQNKTVAISEIFKWYEKDFIQKNKNILEYINTYRKGKIPLSYKTTYYPYDWRINNI